VISKAKNPTQKRISELLYLEKSTVNRNLERLLQQKVISFADGKDLVLTEAGLQLLNNIIPHWEKAMTEIKEILTNEGETALNLLAKQLTH
jgi:DNA-binding MarR family transcriptional regulator